MKARKPERSRASLALSVVVHVVVIAAFATMTFRYPLSAFLDHNAPPPRPESLHFMVLPAPAGGSGTGSANRPAVVRRAHTPTAPLLAPSIIPSTITAPPPSGATTGKPGGRGGSGVGVATGVEPEPMDPRLYAPPIFVPVPKTAAQRVDSAIRDAFGVYYDSVLVAQANPSRAPGDWTTTDKNGNRWGWDPKGIHLGKFMIPNAVLAALPLKGIVNGTSPIEQRQTNYIRQSILEHAQQNISEDEFNAAVRRIRERKDRERKEAEKAKEDAKDKALKPIAEGGTGTP